MNDKTDKLTKECILFQLECIREQMKETPWYDQLKILCECTEILSRAYQNINTNNEKQEETNNESI